MPVTGDDSLDIVLERSLDLGAAEELLVEDQQNAQTNLAPDSRRRGIDHLD